MATVFFSYSHRDERMRDELEIHLAMLKRQGLIEAWHDRRILAGDEWDGAISDKLEQANVILLLISPYFLASNYCYDVELKRAMERHQAGDCRVIPVILEPCEWHPAPFGKLLAVPKDGKPVSKYPNQHDAFLEVVQAIRAAVEPASREQTSKPNPIKKKSSTSVEIRSSNLRIKKTFTDHDRDTFLDASFEYVSKLFEQSLDELQRRHEGITFKFRRVNANHFTAMIYRQGKSVSQCGIRLSGGVLGKRILFAHDLDATNSWNESLQVDDDGYNLFLRADGLSRLTSGNKKEQLTQHGAGELYWAMFIESLQR